MSRKGQMAVDIVKTGQGDVFMFGTRKIHLVVINGRLLVRVGGGFMTIDDFVTKNAPSESRKLRAALEDQAGLQRPLPPTHGADCVRVRRAIARRNAVTATPRRPSRPTSATAWSSRRPGPDDEPVASSAVAPESGPLAAGPPGRRMRRLRESPF
jgi:hypothetical protein